MLRIFVSQWLSCTISIEKQLFHKGVPKNCAIPHHVRHQIHQNKWFQMLFPDWRSIFNQTNVYHFISNKFFRSLHSQPSPLLVVYFFAFGVSNFMFAPHVRIDNIYLLKYYCLEIRCFFLCAIRLIKLFFCYIFVRKKEMKRNFGKYWRQVRNNYL